jgi:hypothetical protein
MLQRAFFVCGWNQETGITGFDCGSTDLYHNHSFFQFMCATLTSRNHNYVDNMFLYYENLSSADLHRYLVRISLEGGSMRFTEEQVI